MSVTIQQEIESVYRMCDSLSYSKQYEVREKMLGLPGLDTNKRMINENHNYIGTGL